METVGFKYGAIESAHASTVQLHDIYKLRYQVYINEWRFERPEDHPSGKETDEYDKHSVHFYASTEDEDQLTGTVRIILASELGFPIEKHFDVVDKLAGLSIGQIGEISRLAVSKEYRRRIVDRIIFGRQGIQSQKDGLYREVASNKRRKCEHEIVRGLYLSIYQESKARGLTHWYAVMARGLYIVLSRWGITFQQIGPEKDYHGVRAPYLVSIKDIEKTLLSITKSSLNFFTPLIQKKVINPRNVEAMKLFLNG